MMNLKTLRIIAASIMTAALLTSACTEEGGDETNGESNEAVQELQSACRTLETQADCSGYPSVEDEASGVTYWCSWSGWVPVSLDGDTCVLGEPSGSCGVKSASEVGCAGGIAYSGAEGSIQLATSEGCDPGQTCDIDESSGEVYEGPAECACIISPEYQAL